jgi:mannose-1-phosphate guanylyltransferase
VVTASHLADGVREQLPDLPEANLLIEPVGRDTAPAVAWGRWKSPNAMAMMQWWASSLQITGSPMKRPSAKPCFQRQNGVSQGAIATLGITPDYPSTGYGYIEQGDPLAPTAISTPTRWPALPKSPMLPLPNIY